MSEHEPVLLEEVLAALAPRSGGRYIDGTIGSGGHARAVLDHSAPDGRLLGIDLDPIAVAQARRALAEYGDRLVLLQGNFAAIGEIAQQYNFAPVDGILFDLGLSSLQLEAPERGFSFQVDGPLDMRFDPQHGPSACDLVNGLPESELADIIYRYGEERRARRIARAIVEARPLRTTGELAHLVARIVKRSGGIHPATRTFQALRIAVNRELENLERALPAAVDLLAEGGILAVISFHSLEDRIVKRFFVEQAKGCVCPPQLPVCACGREPRLRILTRKPIRPSAAEVERNPRSRSARLRVARREAS